MRIILSSLVLFCLAFPLFSQDADAQRRTALSDSMGTRITRSTAALASFDSRIMDDGTAKVFTSYVRKFSSLSNALQESGARVDFLLRANGFSKDIREERDNYERLLRELETVRTEYDNWLRTVQ